MASTSTAAPQRMPTLLSRPTFHRSKTELLIDEVRMAQGEEAQETAGVEDTKSRVERQDESAARTEQHQQQQRRQSPSEEAAVTNSDEEYDTDLEEDGRSDLV